MPTSMVTKDESAKRQEDFERLFGRYYRPVHYYFAKRGCSTEECQDLTQETFLSVYKGMQGYRKEANVETWMFTIAANIWRNWLRSRSTKKRNAPVVPLEQTLEERTEPAGTTTKEPDPLDHLLASEQWKLLRTELDDLPPRMQDCLLLRLDQGLKYREIATIMNISVDTVKSQLYQARERLKKKLGDYVTDL